MKNGWTTNSYNDRHHYVDGLIHNDNGPAIIWFEGSQFWFKNNKRHREDGSFEQWLKFRAFI